MIHFAPRAISQTAANRQQDDGGQQRDREQEPVLLET